MATLLHVELISSSMSDVTKILKQIEFGDPSAAAELLPLVYDELRKLAAARLAHEKPGQTLQPTALVHEAYLRLGVGGQQSGAGQSAAAGPWHSRGHFFAAAAEAMRRILVENARRKRRLRHGGGRQRVPLDAVEKVSGPDPDVILAVDESLNRLAAEDPAAAEIVNLHFFVGLTLDETADAIGVSRATVYRQWSYARSWLKLSLAGGLDIGDSAEK
jgi:RNA polymerase sigma factor (TIGR02999 family)